MHNVLQMCKWLLKKSGQKWKNSLLCLTHCWQLVRNALLNNLRRMAWCQIGRIVQTANTLDVSLVWSHGFMYKYTIINTKPGYIFSECYLQGWELSELPSVGSHTTLTVSGRKIIASVKSHGRLATQWCVVHHPASHFILFVASNKMSPPTSPFSPNKQIVCLKVLLMFQREKQRTLFISLLARSTLSKFTTLWAHYTLQTYYYARGLLFASH